jgi:O-antigen ligase
MFLVFVNISILEKIGEVEIEYLALPTSLAITIYVLLRAVKMLGVSISFVLASTPLIIIDYLQRGYQGNFWKYAVGVTLTFVILYLLKDASTALWFSFFSVICVVAIIFDTRSLFLLLIAALAITLVQQRLGRGNNALKILVTSAVGGIAYLGFFNLAIGGNFGNGLKSLTLEQSAGDPVQLVFGARPEFFGNVVLALNDPFRLFPGQSLSADEISIVRSSFALSNRDPNSKYVDSILGFAEFHSVLIDFWFHLGLPGVVFVFLILGGSIWLLTKTFREFKLFDKKTAYAENIVVAYACLRIFWDIVFSPISDARVWPLYFVAMILILDRRHHYTN